MFWKFSLVTTSHFETILSRENVTLQELMEEEDILQECKAQNKSLIDFLGRPEIMEEMVNLIVNDPPDDLEEKVKYKYSNIAAELLTSDVPQINDALANNESLLNKLYSFLETEKPLNPLLASFFSKTLGILISRKSDTIFEFLKSKEDFISQLINHLKTSAIMDLLLRLVTCPDTSSTRLSILYWLDEQKTIHRLIALFDPATEDRHANASQALCDIIRMAREQMAQLQEKADPDPLLHTIEATDTISELLKFMFHDGSRGKNESSIVCGILVLLTLLEVKKPGSNQQNQQNEQSSIYFLPESQENLTPLDAERLAQGINQTVAALMHHLQDFHLLLTDPPKKKPIPMTIGILDPPLGNTRIHVARLACALFATNTHTANIELAKLDTMEVLLDLFFKYSWNNFLHTQVEQSIGVILSNPPTENEDEKQEHPLLVHLFSKCQLVQRVLDAWEENEQQQSKPGGHRRGYMGHLVKIANHIAQNFESGVNSQLIKEHIKELPEEYQQKWDLFVSGTLLEINKKHDTPLVGGPPWLSSSEDGDSEYRGDIHLPQDAALQQAFSDYQMQQMTSNFIDQFGFNEDDFGEHDDNPSAPLERLTTANFHISTEENTRNADLFEQTCNERIRPFDDAVNDDVWEERDDHCITFTSPTETRTRKTAQADTEEDPDGDSDDDDGIVRKSLPIDSNTSSANEEMKMDVDQADPWAQGFDTAMDVGPVAMDTGNPWESPVHTVPAQETGWADFDFESSSFPSENSELPSSSVAMETSEEHTFSKCVGTKIAPIASDSHSNEESNTKCNSSQIKQEPCATSEKDLIITDHHTDETASRSPVSNSETSGILNTTQNQESSLGSNSIHISNENTLIQENGPTLQNPVGQEIKLEDSPAKIEENRGKTLDSFETHSSTIDVTLNGPVS